MTTDDPIQFLTLSVALADGGQTFLRREQLPLGHGQMHVALESQHVSCFVVVDATDDALVISTAGSGEAELEIDFYVRGAACCPVDAWSLGEDHRTEGEILDAFGRLVVRASTVLSPSTSPFPLEPGRYLLRIVRRAGVGIARLASSPAECVPVGS